jgi:CheY-like chemotaxis protein
LGADVQIVHDGPAALAAIENYRPDVVLLDIGMPGMDGFEVAKRVRARDEFASVALIALTGWGQKDDRRRTQEAGFDHHLVKPADIATLEAILVSLE